MRRFLFLLPILIFSAMIGFFTLRLVLMAKGDAPDIIPSVLVGKPAPDFDQPDVANKTRRFKTADLKGKVTLINFFASWCESCHAEHPVLMTLAGKGFIFAGVDYKDTASDGKKYLAEKGNPYDIVVSDANGRMAIDFGLYGVPETYLVDKQGVIRFKEAGPLTPEIIENELLPLIKELNR